MSRSARLARSVVAAALRERRRDTAWLVLWSACEALPALVFGRVVAGVIDAFGKGRPGTVAGIGWLFAALTAAATGAIGTRRAYARLAAIVEPLRDALIRQVVSGALRRSVQWGKPPDTGVVARITHQAEIVRDSFAGLVTTARTSVFTAGGTLIGLVALAPAVSALVVVPLLAALALFTWLMRAFALRQRAYVRSEESVAAAAAAAVVALRDVAACGAEDHVLAEVGGHVDAQARAGRAVARMAAARALVLAVGGLVPLLLVFAAALWLLRHGVTAGRVIGAVAYLGGLQVALNTLVLGAGSSGVRFAVTLEHMLAESGANSTGTDGGLGGPSPGPGPGPSPGPVPGPGPGPVTRARGLNGTSVTGHHNQLRLRDVTFGYSQRAEPILAHLDLDVPDGDHLAIVGPSGIGKSTLAGLMTGMLAPLRGHVLLGGADLCTLDLAALARRRVLIPQEAYVFAGTLGENLTYLNPAAGTGALDRAADAVGLSPLVARLGGYRADVRGAALSAGERQLIALTRAYLSPARIAVLDEATCHLDPAAEARAEEAFAERPGTMVVIAHRVSSARRATRILLLDGTRAQASDHASLLESSPLYADLVGHWEAGSGRPAHHPPRA